MFTSIDKAIAALIAPLCFVLASFVPALKDILTTDVVNALVMIVTPILVYLVPNKTPAP